jgi:hypothetical protein
VKASGNITDILAYEFIRQAGRSGDGAPECPVAIERIQALGVKVMVALEEREGF